MNDDERVLTDWLRDGPDRGPAAGLERTLAATRAVRQRPWWLAAPSEQRWAGGRVRLALVAVALVVLASLLAVLASGSPRPHPVTPPTGVARNGDIAYSLDGTIYLRDAEGTGFHAFVGGEAIDHTPTFSPDGTKFAFWSVLERRGSVSLWVANADGSDARPVTGDQRFGTSPLWSPSWSPDGTRLVFATPEPGAGGTVVDVLYVVAADGSSPPHRITEPDRARSFPAWSPDGLLIAFATFGDATEGIGLINPDGTGEQRLFDQPVPTEGSSMGGPSWAPDASAIVYARAAGDADAPAVPDQSLLAVWTLGAGERIVYRSAQSWWVGGGAWSPDGAWISFTEGATPSRTVHIVRPDGTDEHVIFKGMQPGNADCWEIWAPDATALLATCGPFVVVPIDNPEQAYGSGVPFDAQQADWQRLAP